MRMSIENGQVFTIQKDDLEEVFEYYQSTFFDDNSIPQAPCTSKATTHCGSMIASLMISQITNYFNNLNPDNMERTVFKQFDFNLPLAMFETVKLK